MHTCVFQEMDNFLAPSAFFAGHNLTLADPVMYTSLYPVFVSIYLARLYV